MKTSFPEFEVHLGDMLELDWSKADLILANSTCFDQALLNKISEKCKKCKIGTWMFTLTKKLPSAEEDYFNSDEEDGLSSINGSLPV